jgi:Mrp family chromosome partitioning ATPase
MTSPTTFAQHIAAARSRLWIPVACAAAAAAVVAAVVSTQASTYTASAQVGFTSTTMPMQATLVRTPAIAAHALHVVGAHDLTPQQLLAKTSVSVDPESGVVVVRVRDANRAVATQLADGYARAFVSSRRAQISASLAGAQRRIRRQLRSTGRVIRTAGGSAPLSVRVRYGSLLRQEQSMQTRVSVARNGVQVISRAESGQADGAAIVRDSAIAAALGALLGMLLVLASGRGRVRSPREVSAGLRMPILGTLPKGVSAADDPVALRDSESGDHVREIRARIVAAQLPTSPVLLVAGTHRRDDVGTTALSVAFALAEQGRRVTVVDLDIADPELHRRLGTDEAPGVTEVVAGTIRLDDALVTFDQYGTRLSEPPFGAGSVRLLPAGMLTRSPWDTVSAPALRDVFRHLRHDSDIVLVASAALLDSTASESLADIADGLVLVTHLGSLRRTELPELRSALAAVRVRAIGTVVVPAASGSGRTAQALPARPVAAAR